MPTVVVTTMIPKDERPFHQLLAEDLPIALDPGQSVTERKAAAERIGLSITLWCDVASDEDLARLGDALCNVRGAGEEYLLLPFVFTIQMGATLGRQTGVLMRVARAARDHGRRRLLREAMLAMLDQCSFHFTPAERAECLPLFLHAVASCTRPWEAREAAELLTTWCCEGGDMALVVDILSGRDELITPFVERMQYFENTWASCLRLAPWLASRVSTSDD